MRVLFFLSVIFLLSACGVPRPPTVPLSKIPESRHYSPSLKKLVTEAMVLSNKKLDYRFGSSNPKNGGMDCSGTFYYLLRKMANLEVPRQAYLIYLWVKNYGKLHTVQSYQLDSPAFSALKPGDLLFWTGTYHTTHKPPITHVMLYLGKDKENHPLMFGASDGVYREKYVRGVGVFEFTLPSKKDHARFVGYGCIPEYTCIA